MFYASEPVDKLSRMLSCWKPSLFPRSFLSDLLDLTHVQLALLERNSILVAQAAEVTHLPPLQDYYQDLLARSAAPF